MKKIIIIIDVVMYLLFIILMGHHITGNHIHEILGTGISTSENTLKSYSGINWISGKRLGTSKSEFENKRTTHGGAFGMGEPNVNYAKYFVGNSYLKMLDKTESGVSFANVTFEPRCRNNWHIHRSSKGGGQVLICVEGEGWYQEEGKEARSLKLGDIVVIPANVKHWHGAKKDSWFSHIAVEIPGENTSNEWCEPVSDEEYDKL